MFYTSAADRTALNSTTCPTCQHVGGHHDTPRTGCDCCACRQCPSWCTASHTSRPGLPDEIRWTDEHQARLRTHTRTVLSGPVAIDLENIPGTHQPALLVTVDRDLTEINPRQARMVAAALVEAATIAEQADQ